MTFPQIVHSPENLNFYTLFGKRKTISFVYTIDTIDREIVTFPEM